MLIKFATQSDEPLGRADYVPSSEVVASVDVGECGMFGGIPLVKGFGNPSKVHLHGSRSFVIQMGAGLKIVRQSIDYALEGGAGIDRVGVEPVLHVAKEPGTRSISDIWRPSSSVSYDLVWIQKYLIYVADDEPVGHLSYR
ncbi:hypothetical protein BN1723_000988, partial [Verticillium longisporum]